MAKSGLSQKQRWILEAIVEGNRNPETGEITWLDMDQLLEKIPYETTKESMQFSLRHLIKRNFVVNGESEIRRQRKRRTLVPTSLAIMKIRPPVDTENRNGLNEFLDEDNRLNFENTAT